MFPLVDARRLAILELTIAQVTLRRSPKCWRHTTTGVVVAPRGTATAPGNQRPRHVIAFKSLIDATLRGGPGGEDGGYERARAQTRLHHDRLVLGGCEHGVYSNVGALWCRGVALLRSRGK